MATLLSIINAAQARLNLPITSTVVGNTSQTQKQLLSLANQEGVETADAYAWQKLTEEYTFTTTATEEQTNCVFPDDFGWIVDETFFDRTSTLEVKGPINPREWQALKAIGSSVSEPRFRIRGDAVLFNPVPTAGHTCVFEFVSKNWCENSAGSTQYAEWNADTDVPLLNDNVFILGVIWRWKASKELDYSEAYNMWFEARERAAARDGAKRKLSIVGPSTPRRGRGNIPEGSWT